MSGLAAVAHLLSAICSSPCSPLKEGRALQVGLLFVSELLLLKEFAHSVSCVD